MDIRKLVKVPLGITGASLGLGLLGAGIKEINVPIGEQVSQAGVTSAKFISPAINITMGGYLIKQLKNLKEVK